MSSTKSISKTRTVSSKSCTAWWKRIARSASSTPSCARGRGATTDYEERAVHSPALSREPRGMEQGIQIAGAILVLLGYVLSQTGKLDGASRPYLIINLVGSAFLAVAATL